MHRNLKLPTNLLTTYALDELITHNAYTSQFGLTLTEDNARELIQTRNNVLQSIGRIELGAGIIDKLIFAFCDSPFISQSEYPDTISGLLEQFYYFKGEFHENISDDELISLMCRLFNDACQGSTDALYYYLDEAAAEYRKEEGFNEQFE